MPKNNYRSIDELVSEVVAYTAIDLVQYAAALDSELIAQLEDPKPGLFLPGQIEPFLDFSSHVKVVPSILTHGGRTYDVTLASVIANIRKNKPLPPGDFYTFSVDANCNEVDRKHVPRPLYERVKRWLDIEPQSAFVGCDAAVAVVLDYLNNLCRYTQVYRGRYSLQNLVKEEFHRELERELFENALEPLIDEVKKFVGRDTWARYFYKVKGTTLMIEKGLDYRIIDFHKRQIEESEGYDHDRGGVTEGYDVKTH